MKNCKMAFTIGLVFAVMMLVAACTDSNKSDNHIFDHESLDVDEYVYPSDFDLGDDLKGTNSESDAGFEELSAMIGTYHYTSDYGTGRLMIEATEDGIDISDYESVPLLQTASHSATHVSAAHLEAFYKTFDEVKNNRYDGMIITGAPVETMDFEQVDYWNELCEIMDFSETGQRSPGRSPPPDVRPERVPGHNGRHPGNTGDRESQSPRSSLPSPN